MFTFLISDCHTRCLLPLGPLAQHMREHVVVIYLNSRLFFSVHSYCTCSKLCAYRARHLQKASHPCAVALRVLLASVIR
jgi:hypothetical protein